jgi:hypothetical protein
VGSVSNARDTTLCSERLVERNMRRILQSQSNPVVLVVIAKNGQGNEAGAWSCYPSIVTVIAAEAVT